MVMCRFTTKPLFAFEPKKNGKHETIKLTELARNDSVLKGMAESPINRESLHLPSMSLAVDEDEDSLLLLTAVVEGVTGALSGTAGAGESEEKSRR